VGLADSTGGWALKLSRPLSGFKLSSSQTFFHAQLRCFFVQNRREAGADSSCLQTMDLGEFILSHLFSSSVLSGSKLRLLGVTTGFLFLCIGIQAQINIKHAAKARPSNAQLASPDVERRVNTLLHRMTLDEKLGQLVQYNDVGYTAPTVSVEEKADLAANPEASYKLDPMQLAATGRLGTMLNVVGAAKTNAFQKAAV